MKTKIFDSLRKDFFAFKGISDYYLFSTKNYEIFRIDNDTYDLFNTISHKDSANKIKLPEEIEALALKNIADKSFFMHQDRVRTKLNEVDPELTSLNIFLTDRCNMSCKYCFSSSHSDQLTIDLSTAYRAVDFYIEKMKPTTKPLAVNFFGGEPLLRFDDIEKIVFYIKNHRNRLEKPIYYYLTTNAYLVESRMIDFFNANNFKIVVSLDGNEEIHDANRRTKNGNGSFFKVRKNLDKLIETCKGNVRVRATISPLFPDVSVLTEYFRKTGIEKFGFELMYESDKPGSLNWSIASIQSFKNSYIRYIETVFMMIKNEKISCGELELIKIDLERIRFKKSKYIPCQMSRESITISPSGSFFPCHWLVGKDEWIIGSPEKGFSLNRIKSFPQPVFDQMICGSCWARFLCGGGCPAVGIRNDSDIICIDRKTRWEGMLALYSELLKEKNPLIEVLQNV